MFSDDEPLTAEQFIDRFYRRDKLRDPGSRERIIADREISLREKGEAVVSYHDSVTGDSVVLVNPCWRPTKYLRWLVT